MKITFIEHSGFMVEIGHTVLLFDYYQGEIPTFNKDKTLYVFVSHSHADHYNPVIWKLKEQYEKVHYIISDDVKTKEDVLSMKPPPCSPGPGRRGGAEARRTLPIHPRPSSGTSISGWLQSPSIRPRSIS